MINLMEAAVGRSRRRVNEGKMKELWMLIKQGKSAEEIAEILNVDVATIKSFMAPEEKEVEWLERDSDEFHRMQAALHAERE